MKKPAIYAYLLTGLLMGFGIAVVWAPGQATALSGSDFKAGRIIDDGQFFDGNAMSTGEIQAFLNAKVPVCDTNGTQMHSSGQTRAAYGASVGNPAPYTCLKDYRMETPTKSAETGLCAAYGGGNRSAAEIIRDVGSICGVSQKVLIVLLQKEQTLITDEWPWSIQYRSATGYGCPDTAPCDAEYYGYFNQVYHAARQFKRYARDANTYNFRVGVTSNVQYNPQGGCGGSNVLMQSQATAGLYNYTPYQPNAAALNNLYGTGDSCSAYGNRNFWRMFNDWFGATAGDGYMRVISDDGTPTQYIYYGGIKQPVPSQETLIAWGLQNTPLITFPSSFLASIPTGPSFDRYFIVNGGKEIYFVDNGKRYWIPNMTMFEAWGFSGRVISSVSKDLGNLPLPSGDLMYALKSTTGTDVYMAGGKNGSNVPIIHKYASSNVLAAWENDTSNVITLSDSFFDSMDDAIGSQISSTRISYGGIDYQVGGGRRFTLADPYKNLYPATTTAVSAQVFARLYQWPPIQHLVRSASGGPTYLIDGGTKHHLLWPDALAAWMPDGTAVTVLNDGFLALIPTGTSIGSYAATVSSQLYIIDKKKTAVPSDLSSAYQNAVAPLGASQSLMDVFPNSGSSLTGFIKNRSEPQVYLLDDSGRRRHLQWADKVTLWGGYKSGVTVLPDYIVNAIATAQSPGIYVTDGTTNYVLEDGKKWPVSAGMQTEWGLASPQLYSDGTLSRFATGDSLTNSMRDGSGGYFLIRNGSAYSTADRNIAAVWALEDAQVHNAALIGYFMRNYMLTRFVRSTTDSRLFVINNGDWFNLTTNWASNFKATHAGSMALDPSLAPNTIVDWSSLLVKRINGEHFVIDGGAIRYTPTGTIQNQWTVNGSLTVPTVSNGFLNLMPYKGFIERAIQGSSPAVYYMQNNTKRHILYPDLLQNYVPFAKVSDQLLVVITDGSPIAN